MIDSHSTRVGSPPPADVIVHAVFKAKESTSSQNLRPEPQKRFTFKKPGQIHMKAKGGLRDEKEESSKRANSKLKQRQNCGGFHPTALQRGSFSNDAPKKLRSATSRYEWPSG
jgi:hypothetical protein